VLLSKRTEEADDEARQKQRSTSQHGKESIMSISRKEALARKAVYAKLVGSSEKAVVDKNCSTKQNHFRNHSILHLQGKY